MAAGCSSPARHKNKISMSTTATIKPTIGCAELSLTEKNKHWVAELYTSGMNSDIGIQGQSL